MKTKHGFELPKGSPASRHHVGDRRNTKYRLSIVSAFRELDVLKTE